MVGRSAAMNQSETKAEPNPPAASSPTETASGDARGALARLLLRGLSAHVGDHPRQIDAQQGDGGDGRDLALVPGGGLVGRVGQPDEHDDEARDQQQRRGVVGQPRAEAHHPVGCLAGAHDDHEAQDEQRVGEDRADDRRLCDHHLAGAQGEDDDEELGQVAQGRLQQARRRWAEALADLLGGQRDDMREAGQRHRGRGEGEQRRPVAKCAIPATAVATTMAPMTMRSVRVSPPMAASEDTGRPHYAARRCCASPSPACAPAAA